MTGRYPFLGSYTHRLPSPPAVIILDPSGVNWTDTTSPLCCRCSAMTAVVSTSYTRLDPPLKPTASARTVLAFVTSDPFLPPV